MSNVMEEYEKLGYCPNCKKLKALEIIKDKRVNIPWFFDPVVKDYIDYNVWCGAENLTKEEFKLLKEVLK